MITNVNNKYPDLGSITLYIITVWFLQIHVKNVVELDSDSSD